MFKSDAPIARTELKVFVVISQATDIEYSSISFPLSPLIHILSPSALKMTPDGCVSWVPTAKTVEEKVVRSRSHCAAVTT